MENIYNALKLHDFSYCKPAMLQYLERQKSYVRLKHKLPPEELRQVTEKLEPFLKKWNYPIL
jgi:hypothetical protein